MIWAKVTTSFEGIHCYPDAPQGVEFLKYPHRHQFHVTAWIEQKHDNRDVEFLLEKRYLEAKLSVNSFPLHSSCEMMAQKIGEWLQHRNPERQVRVEVSEDGENGAVVELPGLFVTTDV